MSTKVSLLRKVIVPHPRWDRVLLCRSQRASRLSFVNKVQFANHSAGGGLDVQRSHNSELEQSDIVIPLASLAPPLQYALGNYI